MKEALSGSSSGEAGGEIDGGGNKGPGRGRLAALMAVLVAVIVAACVGLGLYLAFRDRESASSLFDRGARAFEEGRYDEAIDLYKKALEKEPESSIGYNLLGMGYRFLYLQARNTGYREKEVEAFRRAIELDPGTLPHSSTSGRLFTTRATGLKRLPSCRKLSTSTPITRIAPRSRR